MDNLSHHQRSHNMRMIKSRGTKLERLFSSLLRSENIYTSRSKALIYGNPDFIIKRRKIAIFIDSCFWHKCRYHFIPPKSHKEYWDTKIVRNVVRDKHVNKVLRRNGWIVIRIWEHSIKIHPQRSIKKIKQVYSSQQS